MKAGVAVKPLIAVEGNPTGPTILVRYGRNRRHVSVVIDEVVVGGEVIALDGSDAGAAGVGDGVVDKANVVRAAAEETVGGVALAIEVKAAKFEIGGFGRKAATADMEHRGSVSSASPDEVDRTVVKIFVDDPRRGRTARGGSKRRIQSIGAAEETHDRAGPGSSGRARKGFGG